MKHGTIGKIYVETQYQLEHYRKRLQRMGVKTISVQIYDDFDMLLPAIETRDNLLQGATNVEQELSSLAQKQSDR